MSENGNEEKEMDLIAENLQKLCQSNERIAEALEALAGSVDGCDHVLCVKGNITTNNGY